MKRPKEKYQSIGCLSCILQSAAAAHRLLHAEKKCFPHLFGVPGASIPALQGTACGKSRQCCSQSRDGAGRLLWRLQLCLFGQIWSPVAAAGFEARTACSGWERPLCKCSVLLSPCPQARGGSGFTPGLFVTRFFVISTPELASAGRELTGGAGTPWELREWCHCFSWSLRADKSLGLGSGICCKHRYRTPSAAGGEAYRDHGKPEELQAYVGHCSVWGHFCTVTSPPHCWVSADPA